MHFTQIPEKVNGKDTSLHHKFFKLSDYLNKKVIGQEKLVNRLLIALLADGHLLVEGAPGLAKTRAIKMLSTAIDGSFHRVQFTPDLLPADLTGTEIYRVETGAFEFLSGPLFHNLVLADEINRAPAKVQSALLEAMAEGQITVGKKTYTLPKLFLVMATQNPIEQHGTYALPEAQLDRFLLKVNVDYPDAAKEIEILNMVLKESHQVVNPVFVDKLSQDDIFQARNEVLDLFMADNIQRYIAEIILATRHPAKYSKDLASWIQYGSSPRGTIGLAKAAKALAFLQGKDYVGPEHVQSMAFDVLRHRLILTYKAEAEGITADHCIQMLIEKVAVP